MRNLPLPPFLFALFYIVFPMAFNASDQLISPYEAFWPVVWAVGVIGLVLVLGRWALGCWRKSGLVTLVLVLQFFSYRGVYWALENAGWSPSYPSAALVRSDVVGGDARRCGLGDPPAGVGIAHRDS